MPDFKSLKDLEKYLEKQINDSLKTDVAEKSKNLMEQHIETDVYSTYSPTHYIRTGELLRSVVTNMLDENTLTILNIRSDGTRYIPYVIEYGKGYEWGDGSLDARIGARPFISNTRKELESGLAREFMRDALKKRGLDVK